jgi:hypothetical protein
MEWMERSLDWSELGNGWSVRFEMKGKVGLTSETL